MQRLSGLGSLKPWRLCNANLVPAWFSLAYQRPGRRYCPSGGPARLSYPRGTTSTRPSTGALWGGRGAGTSGHLPGRLRLTARGSSLARDCIISRSCWDQGLDQRAAFVGVQGLIPALLGPCRTHDRVSSTRHDRVPETPGYPQRLSATLWQMCCYETSEYRSHFRSHR